MKIHAKRETAVVAGPEARENYDAATAASDDLDQCQPQGAADEAFESCSLDADVIDRLLSIPELCESQDNASVGRHDVSGAR